MRVYKSRVWVTHYVGFALIVAGVAAQMLGLLSGMEDETVMNWHLVFFVLPALALYDLVGRVFGAKATIDAGIMTIHRPLRMTRKVDLGQVVALGLCRPDPIIPNLYGSRPTPRHFLHAGPQGEICLPEHWYCEGVSLEDAISAETGLPIQDRT
jgi:hypothetical protein